MVPIFEKGVNMEGSGTNQHMFRREYFGKSLSTLCGGFLVVLTIAIGCFLLAKGMLSFTQFHHSVSEFLFSPVWKPTDTEVGGGQIGAAIYIWGSILTCAVALVIAIPFSLSTAIFMTQISPKIGEKIIRPAVEIFVGSHLLFTAGSGWSSWYRSSRRYLTALTGSRCWRQRSCFPS